MRNKGCEDMSCESAPYAQMVKPQEPFSRLGWPVAERNEIGARLRGFGPAIPLLRGIPNIGPVAFLQDSIDLVFRYNRTD